MTGTEKAGLREEIATNRQAGGKQRFLGIKPFSFFAVEGLGRLGYVSIFKDLTDLRRLEQGGGRPKDRHGSRWEIVGGHCHEIRPNR